MKHNRKIFCAFIHLILAHYCPTLYMLYLNKDISCFLVNMSYTPTKWNFKALDINFFMRNLTKLRCKHYPYYI